MMMYSLTNPGGGGGAGSSKWGGGANSTSMIGDGNTSSSGSGGYSTSQPLSLFSPPPAPPTSSASSSSSSTITDLEDMPLLATLIETDPITSVSVSEDGRYALVNLCTQEIHLWDLEQRKSVRKYLGQKQGRFVIRSCFGGVSQGFVLSGSEGKKMRRKGKGVVDQYSHSRSISFFFTPFRFSDIRVA